MDVSKPHLNGPVNGQDREVGHTRKSIRSLAHHLTQDGVTTVVLEATGRMHRVVAQSLRDRGVVVVGLNPRQARDVAKATGQWAKTDRGDARILAAFGAACPDQEATPQVAEEMDHLRDRLVMRHALVTTRADLKLTHAERALDDAIEVSIQTLFNAWDQQIDNLDTAITDVIRRSQGLHRSFAILLSVPGVGPITAASLVAWMTERGTLTHRQIAALIGVAPLAADSGRLKGSRHIRGGRTRPRNVLYMAALTASFHHPEMVSVSQRLRTHGKPHKVALVAVMRKMIVLINALLRDQRGGEDRTPLTGV